jgi:hypothetical protein
MVPLPARRHPHRSGGGILKRRSVETLARVGQVGLFKASEGKAYDALKTVGWRTAAMVSTLRRFEKGADGCVDVLDDRRLDLTEEQNGTIG